MAKRKSPRLYTKLSPIPDFVEVKDPIGIRVGTPVVSHELGQNLVEQVQFGLGERASGVVIRSLDELKDEWGQMMERLNSLVAATAVSATDSFAVDSLEFSLGFSAKGKLVFLAEAGVEATVKLVFKPRTDNKATTP